MYLNPLNKKSEVKYYHGRGIFFVQDEMHAPFMHNSIIYQKGSIIVMSTTRIMTSIITITITNTKHLRSKNLHTEWRTSSDKSVN